MNIFSFKLSGLAFAALLAAGAASVPPAPARAQSAITVDGARAPTALVRHADLNLAGDAGVRRLQARIRHAAERLCVERGVTSVAIQTRGKRCVTATVAAAQPQLRRAIAEQAGQRFAAATVRATNY